MKRLCLFSIILLCALAVTVCYGERFELNPVVDGDKGESTTAYDIWAQSNDLSYADALQKMDDADDESAAVCEQEKRILVEEVPHYQESYYDRMVQQAAERRWALPLTFDYSFESRAFDACGNKVSLSSSLFGSGTRIRDIFLLARLSADDKLHLQIGNPVNPVFGNSMNQQYLALLAPMHVGMTATQNNATLGINGLYRWQPWDDTRLFCIFGVELPILIQKRSLDVSFQDGTLFKFGYTPNAGDRETTITQFFKDWTSVEDFFLRGVLGSKGITFTPNQQTIGLVDLSLSANLEFGPFYAESQSGKCQGLDFGQVGLSIGFPTGKKASASDLWASDFGNGGGYQFTLFGTCNTRTAFSFINPTFNCGIELHTRACRGGTYGLRIPRTITATQDERVVDIPNLNAPCFKEYLTDAFSEQDTTVAAFANGVANASVKSGRRAFVGIGNYFYDLFYSNFRLGLFYNYSSKKADDIRVQDSSLNTTSLQYPSSAHRLSWKLSYKFENLVELGFGSQHIIAGRSVPEQHDVFLSLVASF